MLHHAGTDHVEVDVGHAIPEVRAALDHRAVVTSVPERADASLPDVVPLRETSLEFLHETGQMFPRSGSRKEVHVI